MSKLSQCEMYEKFIEENTDIALLYLIWEDNFLEPQIFTNEVDAEDIDYGELNQ